MATLVILGIGAVLILGVAGLGGWLVYAQIGRLTRQAKADTDGGAEAGPDPQDRAIMLRFILVGGLALLMLLPLGLVHDLVQEREEVRSQAITSIVQPWGSLQVIAGPLLAVPVQRTESGPEGGARTVDDVLIILPRTFTADADLAHSTRARGIHEAVVYGGSVTLEAAFALDDARRFAAARPGLTVFWERAALTVGLTDLRPLRRIAPLVRGGEEIPFRSGSAGADFDSPGFHAPYPLDAESADPVVTVDFSINGSRRFAVVPVGEQSTIRLASTWPHPSYQGMGLPDEHTEGPDGFSATWTIPSLARDFPQVGLQSEWDEGLRAAQVGAEFYEPVSPYSMVERAVKYGVLFIALTFALFLAVELRGRDGRLHPVQYLLVGLSMATFFLVLLALSEHIPFVAAYAIAGAISAGMIGAYIGSAVCSRVRGLAIAGLHGGIYAMLFAILRLEDYALLMGAALVLLMLGLLMVVTRRLVPAEPPGAVRPAP